MQVDRVGRSVTRSHDHTYCFPSDQQRYAKRLIMLMMAKMDSALRDGRTDRCSAMSTVAILHVFGSVLGDHLSV